MDRIQRNIVTAVSTAELEERFNPEYIRTKGIGEDILPIAEESIIIKDSLMIHHLIRGGCYNQSYDQVEEWAVVIIGKG